MKEELKQIKEVRQEMLFGYCNTTVLCFIRDNIKRIQDKKLDAQTVLNEIYEQVNDEVSMALEMHIPNVTEMVTQINEEAKSKIVGKDGKRLDAPEPGESNIIGLGGEKLKSDKNKGDKK